MGENSKIEWTDHTFNPWMGCTKVSPACDGCYAEAMMDHRYLTRICLQPQKPGSVRAGIHLNALAGRYCESGVRYVGDWDISGPAPDDTWSAIKLDWVIAGGETDQGQHNARPSDPAWFRSLRDQCAAAGTAFHFKQWGEHAPNWLNDENGKVAGSEWIDRMGKKRAGRLLDGVEHNGFPS